ncbi:MAG: hypothetical protein P4M07_22505 [Xanthobacteraceae bacterium]|nr:hypothetical protein [Xanthobacteraceae bacterium]
MLKSISAALLAASILAAPALAAGTDKTAAPAPAAQTSTTAGKTADVGAGKTLNARASMHKGRHHRHHRHHKHVAGVKTSVRAHVVKAKSGTKHLSMVKTAPAKTKG